MTKEECDMDADDLMMMALDAGAEDFSEEEDSFEIIDRSGCISVKYVEALEEAGIPMAECGGYHDSSDLCRFDKMKRILKISRKH